MALKTARVRAHKKGGTALAGLDPRERTELSRLTSRRNGILLRLKDPAVSDEEKARAQLRLQETEQAIKKELQGQDRLRAPELFKVDAL